jgi:hypothetical protein
MRWEGRAEDADKDALPCPSSNRAVTRHLTAFDPSLLSLPKTTRMVDSGSTMHSSLLTLIFSNAFAFPPYALQTLATLQPLPLKLTDSLSLPALSRCNLLACVLRAQAWGKGLQTWLGGPP